jgi:hypothetical protein
MRIRIAQGVTTRKDNGLTNLVVSGFTLFYAVQAEYIAVLGVIVTQDRARINVGGFDPSHVTPPL